MLSHHSFDPFCFTRVVPSPISVQGSPQLRVPDANSDTDSKVFSVKNRLCQTGLSKDSSYTVEGS